MEDIKIKNEIKTDNNTIIERCGLTDERCICNKVFFTSKVDKRREFVLEIEDNEHLKVLELDEYRKMPHKSSRYHQLTQFWGNTAPEDFSRWFHDKRALTSKCNRV